MSAIVGENGVLNQATGSSLKTKLAGYLEELKMNVFGNSEVIEGQGYVEEKINCLGNDIKKYIPSMEDSYINDFAILDNELIYIGTNDEIKKSSQDLGIVSNSNGQNVKEIFNYVDNIKKLNISQPKDNDNNTPTEFQGIRLYDKNQDNATTWRIVIDYTLTNQEKARFGSGWYLITKTTKQGNTEIPTILNGNIEVKNNYVINYSTGEMKILSNYKEWYYGNALAVDSGLVVSLDATNLANGTWNGVENYGGVTYNSSKKSLYFDGTDDYLKITQPGDFKDGFTFEMYVNFDRLQYDNGSEYSKKNPRTALFCKINDLDTDGIYGLRFGADILKLHEGSSWTGVGYCMRTYSDGSISPYGPFSKISKNVDTYITYIYRRYKDSNEEIRAEMGWTENADRIECYINGILEGYAYLGSDSYTTALTNWGNDCPFFVGVCPWGAIGNLFYLKGNVYSCRLYNKPISVENAKDNYDATVQFRNSGL